MSLRGKKYHQFKTPKIFKIIIIVIACIVAIGFSTSLLYDVHHYPSDSLSNYCNTHWISNDLDFELYVDENGIITGIYNSNDTSILFDVFAAQSTYSLPNYLYFDVSNENTINYPSPQYHCAIELECFYHRIDEGILFVKISFFDKGIIKEFPHQSLFPYKFELFED